jgi:hypothetical protein
MAQPTSRQLYFAVLNLMRLCGSIPAGFCCVAKFSRPTPGYCVSASLSAAKHVSNLLSAILKRPFRHDDGEWVLEPDEAAVLMKAAGITTYAVSGARAMPRAAQVSHAA